MKNIQSRFSSAESRGGVAIQIERVNSVLNMFLGYLYLVIDVILSI